MRHHSEGQVRPRLQTPIILDIRDTIKAAKESSSLIQVGSSDIDDGAQFDLWIHPDHIVEIKIEKQADPWGQWRDGAAKGKFGPSARLLKGPGGSSEGGQATQGREGATGPAISHC